MKARVLAVASGQDGVEFVKRLGADKVIDGHRVEAVDSYAGWLSTSPIPKLFINADPAGFLIGAQREFCRTWPNQQEVTVKGAHFLQEDSPDEVGDAIARFAAKVLAGQIRRNLIHADRTEAVIVQDAVAHNKGLRPTSR